MKAAYIADVQRHQTLRRVLSIVRILANEALTLQQLAHRVGVTDRTVRRDLYLLQAVGIDVVLMGPDGEPEDADWPAPANRATNRAVTVKVDVASWQGLPFLPA